MEKEAKKEPQRKIKSNWKTSPSNDFALLTLLSAAFNAIAFCIALSTAGFI